MVISANVVMAVMLLGAVVPADMDGPARATGAGVTSPHTAAGRGLTEFLASFNAGGNKRKVWIEGRTAIGKETAPGILEQDAALLDVDGPMAVVRVPKASATRIHAVIRHEKSGAHGYLALEVDPAAPNKITSMRLRPATDDEVRGGSVPPVVPAVAAGLLSGPLAVWFASALNTRQNRRDSTC